MSEPSTNPRAVEPWDRGSAALTAGGSTALTAGRGPWALGVCAVTLLIVIASLRALVSFSPQLWWATNPRLDKTPPIGFGPLGAAVTDWLGVVTLALAVLHAMRAGRRVLWPLVGLWVIGAGFAVWHARIDSESMRVGGNWIGALALGLAAAHLAGDPRLRRVIVAALVALVIPLGAQALMQVTVDHRQTVKDYEEHKEDRLAQRGWEPGSTEALQFENRLYQREATGRFGLANVFGTVALALTMVAVGVAATFRPRRIRAGFFAVAALGVVALCLSFSRGAILALICTTLALLAAWYVARRWKLGGGWWSTVAVLVVFACILGVVALGQTDPPTTLGPKASLVFRWYYWEAGASMLAEHPVAGVGPGRFQEFYLVHKNPLNPEEVQDPHNVFVAFVSTLGLGGIAMSLVLLVLLGRSGSGISDQKSQVALPVSLLVPLLAGVLIFSMEYASTHYPMGGMGLLVALLAGAVIAMGFAAWRGAIKGKDGQPAPHGKEIGVALIVAALGATTWLLPSLGVWLVGGLGFVSLAVWLSNRPELETMPARLGLFAAAVAAMLHSQIEMSMTHAMAGPLLMTILGTAAAAEAPRPTPRLAGWASFALIVVTAITLFFTHIGPTYFQQGHLSAAAAAYRTRRDPTPHFRALRTGLPPNYQTLRDEAGYLVEEPDAGQPGPLEVLEQLETHGLRLAELYRLESNTCQSLYAKTSDPNDLRRAAAAAGSGLKFDPYNIRAHVEAGDLLWRLDERDEAQRLYWRALELSEQARLIPHKQLQPQELAHIRPRLNPEP